MEWRFLPFQRYNPYFKTGMNQALIESVSEGAEPVFFLAGWSKPCVNVGRSQDLQQRVNIERCRADGVKIVRRQGGGGTTYLTPSGELTWGMVADSDFFPSDVNEIYREYSGRIAAALGELGVDARHEPVNDVMTENGKISGATVKQSERVTYLGGTLLLEVDAGEMFRYINPDPEKNERHGLESYSERVTSLAKETDFERKEVEQILKSKLVEDTRNSEMDEKEVERAQELSKIYRSSEWMNDGVWPG